MDGKYRVLELLQKNTVMSQETIARDLDIPEASVRRLIQTLRKEGYRITADNSSRYGRGEYRLW